MLAESVHALSAGWQLVCYLTAFILLILATLSSWFGWERGRPTWPTLVAGGLAAWLFPVLWNTWQIYQH